MRHQRQHRQALPAPSLRSAGINGLLAIWILLLAFAGVSPALHGWLHGETHCTTPCDASAEPDPDIPEEEEPGSARNGHFCGVTTLDTGALATPFPSLPVRAELARTGHTHAAERSAATSAPRRHQARAPPIEIVV